MKKRLFAAALALVCALMMSGCTLVRGFEKDVQVVLNVDGTVAEAGIVNIFNNTIVDEPSATGGKVFRGWTTLDSWEESEAADVPVIPYKGLVRYNDIKDAVKGDSRSVVLKAVFTPAPRKDLVIAWYNKETTSGLNQGHIDAFRGRLYEYLTSEGMNPESMEIVIRGYEGGVADTCAAISKDGDVDFMLGWSSSSNLTGTGGWTEGVDFVENIGGITAGEKARYIARISDSELCLKVYAWVQSAYGTAEETASAPAATAAPAAPVNQNDGRLVIGWYAKSETSGMDESMAAALEAAVRAEFTGVNDIVVRPYNGKVAEVQDAVLKDGDVDVIVGMKAFALEGIEMEVQENVVMGEKTDRRIHRVSGDELAVAAFEWLKTDKARSLFVSAPAQEETNEAEPVNETANETAAEAVAAVEETPAAEVTPVIEETPAVEETPATEETAVAEAAPANKLVIGWYAKSETSGMDENMAAALEAALKAEFTNIAEIIVRPYDGNVADVQAAVIADGDVDVMVGMKKFELEGIEMEVQNDVVMGEKTDRRIHRISASDNAVAAFEWLKTDSARSVFAFAAPAATEEVPVTETAEAAQAAPAAKLVIGWYAKSETSGMDENMAAALEAALKARYENIEVIVRPYDGIVADVQAAVIADGDVDVMVGMKKFELEGIEMEVQNDVVMGEKTDRRIHRISGSELSAEVFKWFETDEARSLFKPV